MKSKRLFLNREVQEIIMTDGCFNNLIENKISDDLSRRLGFRLPVKITTTDEHTAVISYCFKPKDYDGDRSLPEEYLSVLINGEWDDYAAPHTIGLAPRFGGRFQIMIEPEEFERIMKANNRAFHGSRIKSVRPQRTDTGFEVEVVFG